MTPSARLGLIQGARTPVESLVRLRELRLMPP